MSKASLEAPPVSHPIRDLMTRNVIHVLPDTPVLEAVQLMNKKNIGALLVCNQDHAVEGIFTERDLLKHFPEKNPERIRKLRVQDLMTAKILTAAPDQNAVDVMIMMLKKQIRHMPIVSDDRPVGMVSLRDLMRDYQRTLEKALKEKEAQLREEIGKLKESEEQLRAIFENSAVAMIFADGKERIVAWNRMAEAILKMGSRDLQDRPVKDLYPKEEWDRIRSAHITKKDREYFLETVVLTRDGQPVEVELSVAVIKDRFGRVNGSIGIFKDISRRKRAEEELSKSRAHLEHIEYAINQHAIVAVTDVEGRITYVNDKSCIMSGYSREELIGQDHRILNSGYHPKEFFQEMWETILSGKVWNGEIRNKKKNGEFYWVATTIVPLVDEQGRPVQFVAIRNDISSRKESEHKLQLVNRDMVLNTKLLQDMVLDKEKINVKLQETQQQVIQIEKMATLGTLAAGFAHEIKNPLGVILQGMDRIEKIIPAENSNRQYVVMIKNAAQRANAVVTSILRFSRSSQLEVQPLDIYKVIESAVELVQGPAKMYGIEFQKDYVYEERLIDGDHIMLQQIFFDLFDNAIDAMPDGGRVTVTIRFKEDQGPHGVFIIKIADTGTGIPKEIMPKIFDPFVTTKEEGQGTGLGLSTVYMILERHNGTIQVESKEGKGTVFTITLPVGGATEIKRRHDHV